MKKMAVLLAGLTLAASPVAANEYDDRLSSLEAMVEKLTGSIVERDRTIDQLQQSLRRLDASEQTTPAAARQEAVVVSKDEVRRIVAEFNDKSPEPDFLSRFSFGGYGEIHANIAEGDDAGGDSNDQLDIHRFVTYVGYDFADWLKFTSEIEIEHAMVSSGDGGELELEQAYLDFLLSDYANIRVGRTLVPVGYLNQHHEPTTFNGVERPNFYKYVVPTTWWSDGIGLFGALGDITYQLAYLGGMDGSGVSSSGIRGGRLKERPSLNDPAYALRLDYTPFASRDLTLRLGTSLYYSGLDNGNKGNDPGVEADLAIYEADFSFSYGDLDLVGAMAWERIDGAESLAAGVAEEIFGYYLEAGYHVMPSAWQTGKLANADAVFFVRYDEYDTQANMPTGQLADAAQDRRDLTLGVSFWPTTNVVVKADYQILRSDADEDPDNTINFGIGWQF
ncbi:MAG: hypothetical protein C0613_02355 [Desulfobulbaceae bacterium]|nr:MAG: hypothetical protein C0613_02355 [Desulfobulbaceae bacterium]